MRGKMLGVCIRMSDIFKSTRDADGKKSGSEGALRSAILILMHDGGGNLWVI
jgi:hypothetical protein